ncbi:DNA translocase FtsK [Sulfobacillus thermosulfidooxidans DSM 9293]|uniref:DNA translocase FtsK n=1 Tax=Sulfobacillus thermosulfidooxidans (strain DSM 9293 / VKM B-1269 / AT-1) TaxID=929705 RepID=A0A1W1WK03_SULTA|nr:DNA translocase FtsK [Sulfobacillus thermosulfidooxidans]SMC06644.1 DNA translocase FtsK [Sulfobacillus thermosulfidooxidans DSM 9293]
MFSVLKQISKDMRREIGGILLVALGLLGYLSLIFPHSGRLTRDLAHGLSFSFGVLGWTIPAFVLVAGALRLLNRPSFTGHRRGWGAVLMFLGLFILMPLVDKPIAGFVSTWLEEKLAQAIAPGGAFLFSVVLLVIGLMLYTGASALTLGTGIARFLRSLLEFVYRAIYAIYSALRDWIYPPEEESPTPIVKPKAPKMKPVPRNSQAERVSNSPDIRGSSHSTWEDVPEIDKAGADTPVVTSVPKTIAPVYAMNYLPPPLSLLAAPDLHKGGRRGQSAKERADILVNALRQFGIDVTLGEVSQGPTITRFEIIPPPGVKVSRIVNLADDIALSLAATGVRIEAPIPGKSAIGIEVPNDEVTPVLLREVLESDQFAQSPSPLSVGLGRDVAGAPIVTGLDQMPHLLVAGATGSGKSVLINVLITSLLFRASPDVVRLLLIDPKVVELSIYNGIPHLLSPVVTEPKKAAGALRWAVAEMERRYRLFAEAGVRDVSRYNQMAEERLPLIVVIIDELADLMMVAPQDVEESIARLAQMARAAGIHLVVATQRPSVDVITGTIKANIPSRIAFAVSSQVDSRTILDSAGAEKLLGRGDMLFHPVGAAKPQRIQGAFIREKEIEEIVAFVIDHAQPQGSVEAVEFQEAGDTAKPLMQETDPLFPEAVKIVVESGQASTSMLQRRLRVGYTRAARLIDAMEERGYIGPSDGAKAREVRITMSEYHKVFVDESPSA